VTAHEKGNPMRNPMLLLPVLALMILTGCETFKGVGRDVETTGEAITDTSRQVQNDM
jgi:entericidin B